MALNSTAQRRAIFVDKDGTLIENVPFNVDPTLIRLTTGVGPALRELVRAGFSIVVVTNQSGIAHGYFSEQAMVKVQQQITAQLAPYEVPISGFYFCPHHPDGKIEAYRFVCVCRKPMDGMLQKAANELDIDLRSSWMIGDILDDIEAGNVAGCKSVLLNNGNETIWHLTPQRQPETVKKSFRDVARYILNSADKLCAAKVPSL